MTDKVLCKIYLGRMKASYFFFHINHSTQSGLYVASAR